MIETTVDGRYQIVSRIAAGGMGEVYRAHDPVLGRDVAVKILHPTLAGDAAFIDRFRREARSAGSLGHPNIVAVHDWGETGDTYFMVMEFVRGPNLRGVLSHYGPLLPSQAVDAASQMLSALEQAHRQGIVHRDVKPENVLVTPEGVVKMADFGLARALAESRVTTAPGTVTGTVQYLAPEQIEGEPADQRTDLYATGIVLYELLVGRVPFTGETSVAIAYKHLRERVPRPSIANPMVPPILDRVVLEATEPDRDRRVQDAGSMRRDLEASLAELAPAPTLASLAAEVPAVDEAPDRAATVTIPRAASPRSKRRRRLRRGLRWVAVLTALGLSGWASWVYAIPHIEVPNLRGATVEAATADVEENGLTLVVERRAYSADLAAGAIISQEPGVDERVRRGAEISVVVSRGPRFVAIPNVIKRREARAVQMLRAAGLEVSITRDFHEEVPEGRVFEQRPPANGTIESGSTVELVVSKGKPPVSVPRVRGLALDEARRLLTSSGLEVSVTERFSTEVERGYVVSQKPGGGKTVDKGSTVALVVSKGPRQFPMPDVRGMSEDDARAELEGRGLRVRVVRYPFAFANTVRGQDPGPGETVRAGQEVSIHVG
ncbi:MAG TPA: Stk1 family PASTA domain-containing Ser/Thr kinase [Actinomycetota bacterium]|nr:Stk1 family PASTA domain-containing Ser/Thr kinase [Actinomycetota bacterium]